MDLPDRFPELEPMISYWFHMNSWPSVRLSPRKQPTPAFRRMLGVAERLEQIIRNIIDTRRAEMGAAPPVTSGHLGSGESACPMSGGSSGQDEDVLAILIRAHDAGDLTYPQLIGHTTTMFTAAFETTADSLTWTLFLLAQHPDVYADVLDELEARLGGNPPTPDQVDDLPMLEHAIKESLRLLGPAVYNTRFNIQPVQFGDHELPRGSTVFFSHYITHRMPELYPDPQRFNPYRWETIQPGPYEYLPFGAGRRMCIGASYAMMSMKTTLSILLQQFRFHTVGGARIDRHVRISLASARGMPMHIIPQDRAFQAGPVRGDIHEMVDLPT